MRIKQAGSLLLVVAVVVVLTLLGLRVKVRPTADSVALLRTTGMTCGSCSEAITAALTKGKGVAATEVDPAGGWVVVGYDSKSVTPEALARKVGQAGYASSVYAVLSPEQYKRITGQEIARIGSTSGGCGGCGPKGGGCGGNTTNVAKGE